jgi:hypothetical protein
MKPFRLNIAWLVSRVLFVIAGLVFAGLLWLLAAFFFAPSDTQRASDEAVIRREFSIPKASVTTEYKANPETTGFDGRDFLEITMRFGMDAATFSQYLGVIKDQPGWQPLPIPERLIMRMGRVLSHQKAIIKSYPNDTNLHRSVEEMRDDFVKSLPLGAKSGFYLCKYAGNSIMHAPKKNIMNEEGNELPDFMLAVVDPEHRQVRVRVQAWY